METNLTFLSPIKLNKHKLAYWNHTVKTYYDAFEKKHPKHIICDDSNEEYAEKGLHILKNYGANIEYIEPTNSFIGAICKLIEKVETPYFAFITDDVCLTLKEDIFTPSVHFLNDEEKVCQVKIGGGCLSDGNSNLENLDGKHCITFKVNKYNILLPKKQGRNTFWFESMENTQIYNIFPFSYYNCIMRTSVFKKIHEIIKPRINQNDITWSDYLAKINYSAGICNDIFHKGYPEGLEFLNNYETAWLNLCNYIYCFGRHHLNYETFCKTHTEKKYA